MELTSIDVPINEESFYQVQVFLDEEKYNLRFHWNKRNETWKMDVFDTENNPILYGLACLVGNTGMVRRFAIPGLLPYGEIMTLDVNGLGHDPTYENFGDRTGPFYLSVFDEFSE